MAQTNLRTLIWSLLFFFVAGCSPIAPKPSADQVDNRDSSDYHPVILVSLDGFKPDYLHRGVTPNLNQLAASGVRAEAMHPSFPSITFPNHYTLVTGLRPDRNGIVGNTMEDANIPGVRFSLGNHAAVIDHRWWDQAEPIWVTAEKHKVTTGIMFWPGSEAAIHGVLPSEFKAFDGKVTSDSRVDTMLSWLDKPVTTRPGFLTIYFEGVDHAGHEFGPDTEQVTNAVAHLDLAIGLLIAGLQSRHINANIVIVSDHGMAATSSDRTIHLDQIATSSSYRVITSGTYAGIDANAGQEDALANELLRTHEHMQCWKKENIPLRFHYGKNPRVPRFVCLADVGWLIVSGSKGGRQSNGGSHGYDNLSSEMQALFIANGPAFKKAIVLPAFDNVDVYPLLMKLINVPALPSDGTILPIQPALTLP